MELVCTRGRVGARGGGGCSRAGSLVSTAPRPSAHPVPCRARSCRRAACLSKVPSGPPAAHAPPASSMCTWSSAPWSRASSTTATASGEWLREQGGQDGGRAPPNTLLPRKGASVDSASQSARHTTGPFLPEHLAYQPILLMIQLRLSEGRSLISRGIRGAELRGSTSCPKLSEANDLMRLRSCFRSP